MARASFTAPLTMFSSAKNGESVINLCEAGQSHYWHFIGHHLQESSTDDVPDVVMILCSVKKGLVRIWLWFCERHFDLDSDCQWNSLSSCQKQSESKFIMTGRAECSESNLIIILWKALWFDHDPAKSSLIWPMSSKNRSDFVIVSWKAVWFDSHDLVHRDAGEPSNLVMVL